MVSKGFFGLGLEVDEAITLSNGQTVVQMVYLVVAYLLRGTFGQDTSSPDVIQVVQVLRRIMTHGIKVYLPECLDRLAFQTDIIIIGGGDNGHLRFSIEQTATLMRTQLAALLVDALKGIDSLLATLVELAILAATLTQTHLLHIADQQLYLIVALGYRFSQQTISQRIVHSDHRSKGQMVQRFSTSVFIVS